MKSMGIALMICGLIWITYSLALRTENLGSAFVF